MKTISKREMSISKIGQRRQIVIPKKIKGNEMIIKPKTVVDSVDILTPEEEKMVNRGFRQLKQGRYADWKRLKYELGL